MILIKNADMKKSVLIFGLLVSSLLSANTLAKDSLSNEALPLKIERSSFKTEMLKVKWVKIQFMDNNNQTIERKMRLLKELKPIISKIERELRYM